MTRLLLSAPFVLAALVGLLAVAEPGPVPPATLARRYGLLNAVAPVLAGLALLSLARPRWAALVLVGSVLVVLVRPEAARWVLRRSVARSRWPSACRSAGLAVLDRRPNDLGGATIDIRAEAVEWLPVLSFGRRTGPTSVAWRLTPARGSTISAVAERSEALAAALKCQAISVHRTAPNVGRLEARW